MGFVRCNILILTAKFSRLQSNITFLFLSFYSPIQPLAVSMKLSISLQLLSGVQSAG
jgi:hypothetical protein